MRRYGPLLHAALLAALVSGCAEMSPSPTSKPAASSRTDAPRTVNRNLSGYSLAFKQGYVAGCDSAGSGTRHRDEGRYKNELDYNMGWNDGYSGCQR